MILLLLRQTLLYKSTSSLSSLQFTKVSQYLRQDNQVKFNLQPIFINIPTLLITTIFLLDYKNSYTQRELSLDIRDRQCNISAFLSLLLIYCLLYSIVAVFSNKGLSSSIIIIFSILLLVRHVNIIPQTVYLKSLLISLFTSSYVVQQPSSLVKTYYLY